MKRGLSGLDWIGLDWIGLDWMWRTTAVVRPGSNSQRNPNQRRRLVSQPTSHSVPQPHRTSDNQDTGKDRTKNTRNKKGRRNNNNNNSNKTTTSQPRPPFFNRTNPRTGRRTLPLVNIHYVRPVHDVITVKNGQCLCFTGIFYDFCFMMATTAV